MFGRSVEACEARLFRCRCAAVSSGHLKDVPLFFCVSINATESSNHSRSDIPELINSSAYSQLTTVGSYSRVVDTCTTAKGV